MSDINVDYLAKRLEKLGRQHSRLKSVFLATVTLLMVGVGLGANPNVSTIRGTRFELVDKDGEVKAKLYTAMNKSPRLDMVHKKGRAFMGVPENGPPQFFLTSTDEKNEARASMFASSSTGCQVDLWQRPKSSIAGSNHTRLHHHMKSGLSGLRVTDETAKSRVILGRWNTKWRSVLPE